MHSIVSLYQLKIIAFDKILIIVKTEVEITQFFSYNSFYKELPWMVHHTLYKVHHIP